MPNDIAQSPIPDSDSPRASGSKALRDSEEQLRALVNASSDVVYRMSADWTQMHELDGQGFIVDTDSTRGNWLEEYIFPEDQPHVLATINNAIRAKSVFELEHRVRRVDGSVGWTFSRAVPLLDDQGEIIEWFGAASDVNARREAQDALRDNEIRFRTVFENAGVGMLELGADWRIVGANAEYAEIAGRSIEELIGKDCLEFTHPDDVPRCREAMQGIIDGGTDRISYEKRYIRPDGRHVWVRSNLSRVSSQDSGIRLLKVVEDINEAKAAESALNEANMALRERSEEFYALADNIPALAWMAYADGHVFWFNRRWYEFTGTDLGSQEGWGWESVHDPATLPAVKERWRHSLDTGEPFEMTFPLRGADGKYRSFLTRIVPIRDADGEIMRWFGTNVDVTKQVRAEQQSREQTQTLATLNRIGSAIAAELDLERVVQLVTDSAVELTGAKFGAFFYNVIDATGESYMLYTLSGVDRSAFENFPMPRNTAVFEPTFSGTGVVRSDDITKDPRYGKNAPHHGMPKGHLPVVSYLAVPVMGQSGEVMGGLFFGHDEPGRFTENHETLLTAIAGQAAVAIDKARLYRDAQREIENRMKAEQAVRLLNETLESRVVEEVERRVQTEEALAQLQKMETIGQLSGGIAHDFNNLLQVIHGNLSLIRMALDPADPRLQRWTENALLGAERAAALTQRLLAFSRRQPLVPRAVDTNRLIEGMTDLLIRTLGETVELETVLEPGLWLAEVDPNQLENAILNLAVNARDAMPDGGKMTIDTRNFVIDERYAEQNPGTTPGSFVLICVSDEGVGMGAETLERAIEPFFTTKEVGKGTGLGLSMVFGFAQQSGGHFNIYSEPGLGTTAKIYLPRHHGEGPHADVELPEGEVLPGRGETILLCEDDEEVRQFSADSLRGLGYEVIEAADAHEALGVLRESDAIDLLFSDIILPGGKTGVDLAREAQALRPNLKVLYTSGYARSALHHQGRLQTGVELIPKPFTVPDLSARLRALLD